MIAKSPKGFEPLTAVIASPVPPRLAACLLALLVGVLAFESSALAQVATGGELSSEAREALFRNTRQRAPIGGDDRFCPDQSVPTRVLVRFADTVSQAEELFWLDSLGYPYDSLSPLGLYVVRTTNEAATQELIRFMSMVDVSWMFDLDCSGGGTRVDQRSFRGGDPFAFEQWHLERIRAQDAWGATTGSEDVVVAIVDSGYDLDNAEFEGRLYRSEEDPFDGFDNDGDGYQDDEQGWDFVAFDETSEDEHNHGSWVSGIWGANTGNGFGIQGVDHKARLVPLRVLDGSNFGFTSSLVGALDYALLHPDIQVVNLSLINFPLGDPFIAASLDALATQAIIIGCAGNTPGEGTADLQYPGAHPAVISISWTDINDNAATNSSSGQSVDFTAPGENVVSLRPTINGAVEADERSVVSGCSFATPQVSGAASLTLAVRPQTDASDFRFLMKRSVKDLGEEGWDPDFGWGLLNVYSLLLEAEDLVFQGNFESGGSGRWE